MSRTLNCLKKIYTKLTNEEIQNGDVNTICEALNEIAEVLPEAIQEIAGSGGGSAEPSEITLIDVSAIEVEDYDRRIDLSTNGAYLLYKGTNDDLGSGLSIEFGFSKYNVGTADEPVYLGKIINMPITFYDGNGNLVFELLASGKPEQFSYIKFSRDKAESLFWDDMQLFIVKDNTVDILYCGEMNLQPM